MPKTDPVLMHGIDADTARTVPVQLRAGGVSVSLDRGTAQVAVCGTKAASGDNTLIAAPGVGFRIVVTALVLQNESTSATTMIAKWGSAQALRVLGQSQGDGLALSFAPGCEFVGGEDQALVLNLSGANSCGYSVMYYVVAVQR